MNNPPTTEPVDHETEHYAHDVSKHVRGYLMVGVTLLIFTAHHGCAFLRQFRLAEGECGGRDGGGDV